MSERMTFYASPKPWGDLQPTHACPKCGTEGAFREAPLYFREPDGRESLIWDCATCRYEVRTDTVDAK